MNRYRDLLHLQHPVYERRVPMPIRSRAAQFAPFAALSGYDDTVQEAGRLTALQRDICEDRIELLNRRLIWLFEHVADHPLITVSWFVPDEKKDGGAYRSVTAQVVRLDANRQALMLQGGVAVPLADLYDLQIECAEL